MTENIAFGRFTLFGRVGHGDLVEVWIAGEPGPGGAPRPCVVKRVAPRYKALSAIRKVFAAEAAIARRLQHPGLVRLLDEGELDGIPFLSLELLDGLALRQLSAFTSGPALPVSPLVELGRRVADALAFAHGLRDAAGEPLGLVHGKLSSANVLVGRKGEVKVADFGVVYAAAQDPKAGLLPTPDELWYMAPELAEGQPHDWRADLFSLGVILVELASGEPLLPNGAAAVADLPALVADRCARAPRGPLPAALVRLLQGLCAPAADARPTYAADVVAELTAIALLLPSTDSLVQWVGREVFVELPRIDDLSPEKLPDLSDLGAPALGTAELPGSRLRARERGESYPTTGSIILEDIIEEASGPTEPEPPALRLPSSAFLPAGESESGPEGSFRLGPAGVRLVCGYDPYLRSIGVPQGGVAEAADPQRFEYYYVGGDRIGPRIVRKALEARMYRDQTVTLLEGSRFLQRSMDALLSDAKPIPRGALSARGGTDSVELEGEEDERFLRIHERRAPRPPARKESTNLRARVLRFLGR